MDYTKAIFAVHITRLANEKLNGREPRMMSQEERTAYRLQHFEGVVEEVLNQVDWTMRIIDRQNA